MPDTWLITGASRGLGRLIVEMALKAGHRVAAVSRSASQSPALETAGDRFLSIACDVADAGAVAAAITTAREHFGGIDIAVNNAGVLEIAAAEQVTPDALGWQIGVNFLGGVYVSQAVLPIMRAQGKGHIINIGSTNSRVPAAAMAAYGASKAAARHFALVLADEVERFGIRVTVMEPGLMATGARPQVADPGPVYASFLKDLLAAKTPGGPQTSLDPLKVAEVVLGIAGRTNAPRELLLGENSYQRAVAFENGVSDADRVWRDVSVGLCLPPIQA